jgi:hypothetical protein
MNVRTRDVTAKAAASSGLPVFQRRQLARRLVAAAHSCNERLAGCRCPALFAGANLSTHFLRHWEEKSFLK